jgi:hypothetical protein
MMEENKREQAALAEDGLSKDASAPDTDQDQLLTDAHTGNGIAPSVDPPHPMASNVEGLMEGGVVRTLDGEIAGDEFAQDAINYQILLGKIDHLLENLKLDA